MLLDINMPVMDGFEVLRTMNTNHTIEDVPVIMISSDDSEEAIREAYELGASDYVNRPFDAKIVYRRVSNTICTSRRCLAYSLMMLVTRRYTMRASKGRLT